MLHLWSIFWHCKCRPCCSVLCWKIFRGHFGTVDHVIPLQNTALLLHIRRIVATRKLKLNRKNRRRCLLNVWAGLRHKTLFAEMDWLCDCWDGCAVPCFTFTAKCQCQSRGGSTWRVYRLVRTFQQQTKAASFCRQVQWFCRTAASVVRPPRVQNLLVDNAPASCWAVWSRDAVNVRPNRCRRPSSLPVCCRSVVGRRLLWGEFLPVKCWVQTRADEVTRDLTCLQRTTSLQPPTHQPLTSSSSSSSSSTISIVYYYISSSCNITISI